MNIEPRFDVYHPLGKPHQVTVQATGILNGQIKVYGVITDLGGNPDKAGWTDLQWIEHAIPLIAYSWCDAIAPFTETQERWLENARKDHGPKQG